MAGHRGWPRFIVLGCFLGGCALLASGAAAEKKLAAPGEFRLHLQLLAENGRIVATEPLLALLKLTNIAAGERTVRTGNDVQGRVYFRIEDAQGRLVGPPRPGSIVPPEYIQWAEGAQTLGPGDSRLQLCAVSESYPFTKPGQYLVRAEWLGGLRKATVLAADEARITVDPFDAGRLEAACYRLSRPCETYPLEGADGRDAAWRALISVKHDVVLPYLDGWACYGGGVEACLAIRRVGTPRAERVVKALAARGDSVGEAARKALQMPLEPTDASSPPSGGR